MNSHELRTIIDHYCVLPPEDPHRRELSRLVAAAPEDVREYYFAALAEQEKLRLALAAAQPEPSDDLAERLLKIPDDKSGNVQFMIRRLVPWAVAAALLLAALAGVRFWIHVQRRNLLKSLAWQSLGLYLNKPMLAPGQVTTASFQKALPAMPFPVELYNYGGFKLTGFAAVTVAGQPAALTRWQRGPVTCLMLQFSPRLIPGGTSPSGTAIHLLARLPGNSNTTVPYTVTVWPDQSGRCGWAVVLSGKQRYHPFDLHG